MKTVNRDENARTLLGEDYPAILEMMENLLTRPVSAPEVLEVLTQAVSQSMTRKQKAHAHAAQARGIAEAQARNITFGRPKTQPPPNFASILELVSKKQITHEIAAKMCGVSVGTYYRMRRNWLAENNEVDGAQA